MAKTKTYSARATDGLWHAVAVTGWIFIALAGVLALSYGYQAILLAGMDAMQPMTDLDSVPGHEDLTLVIGLISLIYIVAYLTGAFLTLRWYLRSIRNARVLHRGITTSPAWVIWYFILPVVSLFRPYTMTSELWRSSLQPEGWKSLRDPALLRWWWALVLGSSLLSLAATIAGRATQTVGGAMVTSVLTTFGFGFGVLAGLLFLRIGGPISRRQTALVAAGHRPSEATIPAWSA